MKLEGKKAKPTAGGDTWLLGRRESVRTTETIKALAQVRHLLLELLLQSMREGEEVG